MIDELFFLSDAVISPPPRHSIAEFHFYTSLIKIYSRTITYKLHAATNINTKVERIDNGHCINYYANPYRI